MFSPRTRSGTGGRCLGIGADSGDHPDVGDFVDAHFPVCGGPGQPSGLPARSVRGHCPSDPLVGGAKAAAGPATPIAATQAQTDQNFEPPSGFRGGSRMVCRFPALGCCRRFGVAADGVCQAAAGRLDQLRPGAAKYISMESRMPRSLTVSANRLLREISEAAAVPSGGLNGVICAARSCLVD